jgi:hypothetical protein
VCIGNDEKSKINYTTEPLRAEGENACLTQKTADQTPAKGGAKGT